MAKKAVKNSDKAKSEAKAKLKPKAKAKAKKVSKEKRSSSKAIWKPFRIIGLIFWPRFLRNSFKELKMVTWPGWKKGRSLTFAVLIFALIFAVVVALVDWGLDAAFKELFLK